MTRREAQELLTKFEAARREVYLQRRAALLSDADRLTALADQAAAEAARHPGDSSDEDSARIRLAEATKDASRS